MEDQYDKVWRGYVLLKERGIEREEERE